MEELAGIQFKSAGGRNKKRNMINEGKKAEKQPMRLESIGCVVAD